MAFNISSNWRTLPLFATKGNHQLLTKYSFSTEGYAVHVTDLYHIWSENLGKEDLLERAQKEGTTIDPSEDGAQYEIMLQKLAEALQGAEDTTMTLTVESARRLAIAITISLPKPLRPLEWLLNLTLMQEDAVRSEVIMPLLNLTYESHHQADELVRLITEKDNVISKILDKAESHGMDLSSIFPNSGVARGGRQGNRREVIAKQVRGLAPFDRKTWQDDFSSTTHGEPEFNSLINNVFARAESSNVHDAVDWSIGRPSDSMLQSASQDHSDQFQRQTTPATWKHSEHGSQDVPNPKTAPASNTPERSPKQTHDDDDETTEDEDFQQAAPPSRSESKATSRSELKHNSLTSQPAAVKSDSSRTTPVKRRLGRVGGTKFTDQTQPEPSSENSGRKTVGDRDFGMNGTRSNEHDESQEIATESDVKRKPGKLGKIGGFKPVPRRVSDVGSGTDSASDTGQKNNPENHSSYTPPSESMPRRLGKIGGSKPAVQNNDEISQRHRSITPGRGTEQYGSDLGSTSMKPSPRKLGRIGGRSAKTPLSQNESQNNTERLHGLQDAAMAEDEKERHAKVESERSLTPPETSEQRADRKREELKRALESNSLATHKRRRRF